MNNNMESKKDLFLIWFYYLKITEITHIDNRKFNTIKPINIDKIHSLTYFFLITLHCTIKLYFLYIK